MSTIAFGGVRTVPDLRDLVDWRLRLRLHQHAIGVVAVVFLTIYGRAVCPFINGVGVLELVGNLGLVFLAQVVAQRSSSSRNSVSAARSRFETA